jgi:hypothetical protein
LSSVTLIEDVNNKEDWMRRRGDRRELGNISSIFFVNQKLLIKFVDF